MEDHLKDNNSINKKKSLSEHIEENQKLITVIGVFTALAIFAKNIEIIQIRTMLSFLFISIAILVWIELSLKKYNNKPTWRLILFDYAILLSILFLVGYWLIEYIDTWSSLITLPLFILFNSIFAYTLKKFDVFNRLKNPTSKKLRRTKETLFYIIVIAFIGLSMILAGILRDPIVRFLNEQKQHIEKIK
jgi:hypothetical protein